MRRKIIAIVAALLFSPFAGMTVYAQQNDATLEFKPSVIQANAGDEFDVQIVVKNAGAQNIISVRSWLNYDTNALEGVSIDTQGSPFTLSAPGEDEFDAQGHVKVGRSNISGGFKDVEGVVATVKFKVKTANPMTATISAYDYQVTELGHTSVNIIEEGFPANILSQEPDKLQIQLNAGATASTQPSGGTTDVTGIGGPALSNLVRPQNLKATTGSGSVDLKWDLSDEAELAGYNIYYGKTSGQYTRLRTAGKVSNYRMDNLTNGEAYYFAVTAYDQMSRESDYSDEVGIIVNQPLSSTSPFEEILASLLTKVPLQPQNGPLVGWLVFSAAGLSGVIVFGRRNCKLAEDTSID
jgi:hypothetical protein